MRTKKTFTAEEQRRHHARKREKKVGYGDMPLLPKKWEPHLMMNANGQLGVVRQLRKRIRQLQADADATSLQKQMLCDRAVFVCTLLETMERLAIEENKFDNSAYLANLNCLVSVLKALGLERARKQATRLESYINAKKVKRT